MDDELRLITAEIQVLVSKIRNPGLHTGAPNVGEASSVNQNPRRPSNLEKICDEAANIAEVILSKLEHRNLNKSRNRKLESFK